MPKIPSQFKGTQNKVFSFTEYFKKSRSKPGHVDQMTALEALSKPFFYEEQDIDGEKRHCILGSSSRFPNKHIRVIVLNDFQTIHNAFFDRSAKKKLK